MNESPIAILHPCSLDAEISKFGSNIQNIYQFNETTNVEWRQTDKKGAE